MSKLNLGDLITVIADLNPDAELEPALASMFGYAAPVAAKLKATSKHLGPVEPGPVKIDEDVSDSVLTPKEAQVPFVRLEQVTWRDTPSDPDQRPVRDGVEPIDQRKPQTPDILPPTAVARWSRARVAPKLVPILASTALDGQLDVPRVVAKLSRAEVLERWPCRSRRRSVASLTVIVDVGNRLAPWHADMRQIVEWLRRWAPEGSLQVVGSEERLPDPVPAGRCIFIGDLGAWAGDEEQQFWIREAERRWDGDEEVGAWILTDPLRVSSAFARRLFPVEFDRTRWLRGPEQDVARDDLLALASLLVQVDAELLRGLRRHLAVPSNFDTEIQVWTSPSFKSARSWFAEWEPSAYHRARNRLVQRLHEWPTLQDSLIEILGQIVRFRVGESSEGETIYWSGEEVFRQEIEIWKALADELPESLKTQIHELVTEKGWLKANAEYWEQVRVSLGLDDIRKTGLTAPAIARWFERVQALVPERLSVQGRAAV